MTATLRCDQCGRVGPAELTSNWRRVSAPNTAFSDGGGERDYCTLECLADHANETLMARAPKDHIS